MNTEIILKRFYTGVENHGTYFKVRTQKTNKTVYFTPQGLVISDIEKYKQEKLDTLKSKIEVNKKNVYIFDDQGTLVKTINMKDEASAKKFLDNFQTFIETARTTPQTNLSIINKHMKDIFGSSFSEKKDGFEIEGDYQGDLAAFLIKSGFLDYAISLSSIKSK